VHICKCGQLPEPEDARGKTDEEKIRGRVESCANDLGARLVEIVSLCDTPARVGYSVGWVATYQVGACRVSVL